MYSDKRVIALIPARAGSKSIPKKNLARVGNNTLVGHAVTQAKAARVFDRIVVSTDGEEIATEARRWDAEVYMRHADLATDTSLVVDTVRDLCRQLRLEGETATYMVMLEPTTPLRRVSDIIACLEVLDREKADSVATFKEADLNPHRAWRLDSDEPSPFIEGAIPWNPRQSLPKSYQLTGAVYAFSINALPDMATGLLFGDARSVIVDKSRSIDIDDFVDLMVVRELYKDFGVSS